MSHNMSSPTRRSRERGSTVMTLLLLFCLTLAGCCGFKMRGDLNVPPYLKTVYITPNEPYEPLQQSIRAQLKAHNVKILQQPKDNIAVLQLGKPTSNEQVLAVGSSGEVQRYQLSVSVSYTLTVPGANKLNLQRSITRTRELNRSNNMLLSNEGEAQVVKRELLHETVQEILRQITARPKHKDNNP